MDLVIVNTGTTLAKDVKAVFDPPLRSTLTETDQQYNLADAAIIRRGLPTMPPGREFRLLFDSMPALYASELPRSYNAKVTFTDSRGRPHELDYRLDLDVYFGWMRIDVKGQHRRSLAQVLDAMFEHHGLTSFHAETMQQALDISRRVLPDLLVLDLMLPDGDGAEILNFVHGDDRLRDIPVIIYTAKDLDATELAELQRGNTEILTKSLITPAQFEGSSRRVGRADGNCGADAIRQAQAEQPDAILLDVMMPDMDGPTAFNHLRTESTTSHIPVILLTAKVQPGDRSRFGDLAVEAVIAKPFDLVSLPGEVAEALGWGP